MKLIKLDAIDSTNEFIKSSLLQELENFTVVTANKQSKVKGRWGQFGTRRRVRI
jgi:BirA family biotin operon repressor/biotin-[acetyl-CoA-carboxylase] ligase